MNYLPLDTFEIDMPQEKRSYLAEYGYEFSKKACEYAVKMMRRESPATKKKEHIEFIPKDQIDEKFKKNNIVLEHANGYNYVYAWHWFLADYKELIPDEVTLCKFVKAAIDDVDMKGGNFFRRFIADCAAKGKVIDWEDIV